MSEKPAITASLLAEYCFASAPRRYRIIEMMQSDGFEPYKKWYGEVPGAYRRYMSTGRDDSALEYLEAALVKREYVTEEDENKILLQLDAIEHIRHIDHGGIDPSLRILPFDHPARSTEVAGVTIRVNPTNLVLGTRIGRREQFVGVLKPYLKKTHKLGKDEAAALITILHLFVERELSALGEPAIEQCFVAEVFFERLLAPPRSYKRRRELIEASCLEIAERWPSVRAKSGAERKGAATR
ncbi:MAG TPA: hypothetical protein VHA07_09520 [Devosia sp.]|nr:hypothetical protein [Devosia sp.]